MSSLNKATLIGNLTADPEVKEAGSSRVASFSIATNRVWKDAQGEKQEQVEFHNITAWGKLADIIEQYVTKWSKVYVEWRLQTQSWEAEDGTKRYKTQIVAENLIMLSSKPKAGNEEPTKKQKAPPTEEINIEDIPF